jgi:hypothetical protein
MIYKMMNTKLDKWFRYITIFTFLEERWPFSNNMRRLTSPLQTWEIWHLHYKHGKFDISTTNMGNWTSPLQTWEIGHLHCKHGNFDITTTNMANLSSPLQTWEIWHLHYKHGKFDISPLQTWEIWHLPYKIIKDWHFFLFYIDLAQVLHKLILLHNCR